MALLIYKQRFRAPNRKDTAKCNYAHIRYIATRPRVLRNEGMLHGLFGKLKPGDLREFRDWKEVAQLAYRNSREGIIMYRSIISFAPETAAELTLDGQKDWQRYVERHILTIARNNGIKSENLAWACAAHGERDPPHVHIAFWDKSARVHNTYTPPEVPNRIRRQLIKETFASQIKEYGIAKDQAVTDLRAVSDALVDDFERSVRGMNKAEYAALRSLYDREDDVSEGGAVAVPEDLLDDFADRLFRIKAAIPPKGRVAYKLLPSEVKEQVDELVRFLLAQNPLLQGIADEYVTRRLDLLRFYTSKPETLAKARGDYKQETEKLIANRILGGIKMLLRIDSEMRSASYTEKRRRHYAEHILSELICMLDRYNGRADEDFNRWSAILHGELSAEAKKELYLKYQDKGYEH